MKYKIGSIILLFLMHGLLFVFDCFIEDKDVLEVEETLVSKNYDETICKLSSKAQKRKLNDKQLRLLKSNPEAFFAMNII